MHFGWMCKVALGDWDRLLLTGLPGVVLLTVTWFWKGARTQHDDQAGRAHGVSFTERSVTRSDIPYVSFEPGMMQLAAVETCYDYERSKFCYRCICIRFHACHDECKAYRAVLSIALYHFGFHFQKLRLIRSAIADRVHQNH